MHWTACPALKLEGTPMRVEYRTGDNPFAVEDKTAPTKAKTSSPVKNKYIKAAKDEVAQTAGAKPNKRTSVAIQEVSELAPKDRLKLRAAVAKKAVKKTGSTIQKYKDTGRPVVKRGQKSTKK
jgi:hypothetical protein